MMDRGDIGIKHTYTNNSILAIVKILGVIFGISGMVHGFFEVLQGNARTSGYFIDAIGESHKMWLHGNEPAFTIIPNFMITGIAAMLVGSVIIILSAKYLHKKHAPLIFLLLFILLLLVGGGVAQVIFFVIGWAFATRIHAPLNWWQKIMSEGIRKILAKLWRPFLIGFAVFLLCTMQIGIFGFIPGVSNPDSILTVMAATVVGGLLLLILSFVSGCANDIDKRGM